MFEIDLLYSSYNIPDSLAQNQARRWKVGVHFCRAAGMDVSAKNDQNNGSVIITSRTVVIPPQINFSVGYIEITLSIRLYNCLVSSTLP